MKLTSKQRKHLETLAHELEPVVRIGKLGITPTLIKTVHENLQAQELIKIKILENSTVDKEEAANSLAEKTSSILVRVIGRILVLFRANPKRKHPIEFPDSKVEAKPAPERFQASRKTPVKKKVP